MYSVIDGLNKLSDHGYAVPEFNTVQRFLIDEFYRLDLKENTSNESR
jgi:hypothetical protein